MYYRIYKHFYYIYIREIMDFIHWIKVISSQTVIFTLWKYQLCCPHSVKITCFWEVTSIISWMQCPKKNPKSVFICNSLKMILSRLNRNEIYESSRHSRVRIKLFKNWKPTGSKYIWPLNSCAIWKILDLHAHYFCWWYYYVQNHVHIYSNIE